MKKVNTKVRDNYDKYCALIEEEKTLIKNQMVLDEDKASRPDFKEKSMPAHSNNIPENITFTVQQKKKEEADSAPEVIEVTDVEIVEKPKDDDAALH